jgi:tetratricopeptide (TPR) repeat protein
MIINSIQKEDITNEIMSWFKQATQYHQKGQRQQAKSYYQKILAKNSDHVDSLHLLGLIEAEDGNLTKGLEYINKALKQRPKFAPFYINRGLIHQRLQQFSEAENDFQTVIQLMPDKAIGYRKMGELESLRHNTKAAISAFEQALAKEPSCIEAHNQLGNLYLAQERYELAERHFEASLTNKADAAAVWNNQGVVLAGKCEFNKAMQCYQKALNINPNFADAYVNQGLALTSLHDYQAAEIAYKKALQLKPATPDLLLNIGNLFKAKNKLSEALDYFRRAQQLDANYPSATFNESLVLLLQGDYENGFAKYETRMGLKEHAKQHYSFDKPRWQGEDIDGKTLFVYVEQGMGDTLQFIRFLPVIKKRYAANIICEAQHRLLPVLRYLAPDVGVVERGQIPTHFDYYVSLLSLPHILKTTLNNIPYPEGYLQVLDQEKFAEVIPKNTKQLKVGLVWAGALQHKNDYNRSVSLTGLAPLFDLPDIKFYSLQYGERNADMQPYQTKIADLSQFNVSFVDAALLANHLDLIITVDTAMVHLMGAMGKRTWLLLPFAPDFRWLLDRDDSPWYQSVKLFRQNKPNDWSSVIDDIKQALINLKGN